MDAAPFHSLKNHFLIAMPQIASPSFAGTLTLICEHNKTGALGIVVNRPTGLTLKEIYDQIGIEQPAFSHRSPDIVFSDGSIAIERGFVIHSGPRHWDSTLKIDDDLSLTTSRDILFVLANNEDPQETLVALGYAGWGECQPEKEISENSWLTCLSDKNIIFNVASHHRVDAAARSIGIDLNLLSSDIGHA